MTSGSWVSNAVSYLLYWDPFTHKENWVLLKQCLIFDSSSKAPAPHPRQTYTPPPTSSPLSENGSSPQAVQTKILGSSWFPLSFTNYHQLLQQILKTLPLKHFQNPNISLLHVCCNLVTNQRASTFSVIKSVLHRTARVSLYYLFRTQHFIYWVRPHHTLLITLWWLLISLRIKFKVLKQRASRPYVMQTESRMSCSSVNSLLQCPFLKKTVSDLGT